MPLNKIPKLREPKGPIVQEIRDKFLEEEYKNAPDEFYPQDIRLIENMDFLLQRYIIMQRKNVEASVKMIADVLRWRKEHKVYDLCDTYFPQEVHLCGAAFAYEKDLFGNRTIYFRACMGRNCTELRQSMKEFLIYLIMQVDDPKDGQCFALIIDLTKTSWSNYDLDMLTFLLSLLKDYFPVNLDYVLAVNFPWILSTSWNLIKHLIPTEKRNGVQFINSNQIFEFIAKENCPDFLEGTCTRKYSWIVEEAPTAVDYVIDKSDGAVSCKRMKEILVQFKDIMPESHYQKLKNQIELYKIGQYTKPKSMRTNEAESVIDNNNDGNLQDLNQTANIKA